MELLKICEWLSHTSWSVSLREGTYDYPVLLIIHVLSIALFGGMVAIGNLRVLGAALRSVPVSQVIEQFRPWKWSGFSVLLITGILLSLSDPVEYGGNVMYWISVLLLLAAGVNALVFRFGIYRSVASWDDAAITPPGARRWAGLSLALWISLIFAGRAIAFF
jgi:hypothetical protein